MKRSAALVLASGETIYCRGDYSPFVDVPVEGTPTVGPWFVVERPGRSELLVRIDRGITLEELTATLARILGPADAREVISRFGVKADASGAVEVRIYTLDQGDPSGRLATSEVGPSNKFDPLLDPSAR